ncbi:hypothetical protein N9M41_01800 [Rhodopirellula sp.]|nr:hypothetical protein [Rhodopirellula sp.]
MRNEKEGGPCGQSCERFRPSREQQSPLSLPKQAASRWIGRDLFDALLLLGGKSLTEDTFTTYKSAPTRWLQATALAVCWVSMIETIGILGPT